MKEASCASGSFCAWVKASPHVQHMALSLLAALSLYWVALSSAIGIQHHFVGFHFPFPVLLSVFIS